MCGAVAGGEAIVGSLQVWRRESTEGSEMAGAGATIHCEACRHIYIVPEDKAARTKCGTCGGAMVALPMAGRGNPTPALPVDGEGEQTTAAAGPEKPQPYLPKEWMELKAKRKAYLAQLQKTFPENQFEWEYPPELEYDEQRLLATIAWMGNDMAAAMTRAMEAENALVVQKAILGVLLKRQGGSVSIREAEINKLGEGFSIAIVDKPAAKHAVTGQLMEVTLQERIQVVTSLAGVNGRS